MSFYRILPIAIVGLIAAACSDTATFDEAAKGQIDCLSSKTVVAIAAKVHEGTKAGLSPDEVSGVRAGEISANLAALKASGMDSEAATYFEFETARRLNAMQDALKARDPETLTFDVDSEAYKTMTDTQEMAEACQFETV